MTKSETEALVKKKVQELLNGPALSQVVQQVVIETSSSYSGPLPPADETAKYERVYPGFTDRWITMSEKEQENLFSTTRRRDQGQIAYKILSLLCASFICLCLVGGGIFLLYMERKLGGFGAIGVACAAVCAAIFKLKRSPSK